MRLQVYIMVLIHIWLSTKPWGVLGTGVTIVVATEEDSEICVGSMNCCGCDTMWGIKTQAQGAREWESGEQESLRELWGHEWMSCIDQWDYKYIYWC